MKASLIARGLVDYLYDQGWEFQIKPWGIPGLDRQVELFLDREYPEEEIIAQEQPNEVVELFRSEFVEVSEMEERQIIRSEPDISYVRLAFAEAKRMPANEWMFKVRHILALAEDLKKHLWTCKKGHMSDGKGYCMRCKSKL